MKNYIKYISAMIFTVFALGHVEAQDAISSSTTWTASSGTLSAGTFGTYFKFVGNNSEFDALSKVNVNGTDYGTYPLTSDNYIGFKVASKTRGIINVYYDDNGADDRDLGVSQFQKNVYDLPDNNGAKTLLSLSTPADLSNYTELSVSLCKAPEAEIEVLFVYNDNSSNEQIKYVSIGTSDLKATVNVSEINNNIKKVLIHSKQYGTAVSGVIVNSIVAKNSSGSKTFALNDTDRNGTEQMIGFKENWDWGGNWWLGGENLKNYSKVEVEFSETTVPFQLVVQDGNDKKLYNDYHRNVYGGYYPAGTTHAELDLSLAFNGGDENSIKDVLQIVVQCGEIGSSTNAYVKPTSARLVGKAHNDFKIYQGTDLNTTGGTEKTPTVTTNGNTKMLSLYYDCTNDGDKVFWLNGAVNIGAIEIISAPTMDNSKLQTSNLTEVSNKISWHPTQDITTNTYLEYDHQYIDTTSEDAFRNHRTLLKNDTYKINDGTNQYSTYEYYAYYDHVLRLKGGYKYKIKVYYASGYNSYNDSYTFLSLYEGENGFAQTEIKKGDTTTGPTDSTILEYVCDLSDSSDDKTIWIKANGSITPTYYGGFDIELIIPNDPYGDEVAGDDVTLHPITEHYLWYGRSDLTSGDTDTDDTTTLNTNDTKPNLVYRGDGATYRTNTTVSVDDYYDNLLSTSTAQAASAGAYQVSNHDHIGILIGNDKKGSIKVYFKPLNGEPLSGYPASCDYTSTWHWETLLYYNTPGDYSGYQFVKITFDDALPIPLKFIVRSPGLNAGDDEREAAIEISDGETEAYLYLDPTKIALDDIKQIALMSLGVGFTDSESYTIGISSVELLKAPTIATGTSANDWTADYTELTIDAEDREDGTFVLIYPFNHDDTGDQLYWISGTSNTVGAYIGAIEVTFDQNRKAGTYDPQYIETTKVRSIPTAIKDGTKYTLKWRVNDSAENGTLYKDTYYEPAGGNKYYQYITNSADMTTGKATSSGIQNAQDPRDLTYVNPNTASFGQLIKLEPNTHYILTIYSRKAVTPLMRLVNQKVAKDNIAGSRIMSEEGLRSTKVTRDGTTTIEFVTNATEENCYYWILGRSTTGETKDYFGFDLTWVQSVTNKASTNNSANEISSKDGSGGEYYRSISDNKGSAFPYEPREFDESSDGIYAKDTDDNILKLTDKVGSGDAFTTMKVMFGTNGTFIMRGENSAQHYHRGGLVWKDMTSQENNGGFLDGRFTYTAGDNYTTKTDEHSTAEYTPNANPQTETNGGIGGEYTEMGGRFLQPVSGDFFRFEPEYDGVVTVWFLQNGNTDAHTPRIFDDNGKLDKDRGNLTRRPVYIVDEDGVVMRQSTIKPDHNYKTNSHYAINGTWAEINDFAWLRSDYEDGWQRALERWTKKPQPETEGGTAVADDEGLKQRYKETMKFYDHWYDGKTYDYNRPGDNGMTMNTINVNIAKLDGTTNGKISNPTTDDTSMLNESQIIGHIVYGSYLLDGLVKNWFNAEFKGRPSNLEGRPVYTAIASENRFAKYGYEVPVHVNVRYVFPVRAGKTYYLGGRGTKNGFSSVKFEPMPQNYNPDDYKISEYNSEVSYPTKYNGKYDLATVTEGTKTKNDIAGYAATYADVPQLKLSDTNGIEWKDKDDTEINEPNTGTTVHAYLNRKFDKDCWYPIVLPFSVSESKMREVFGANVKVLYLDPYHQNRAGGSNTQGVHSETVVDGSGRTQVITGIKNGWYSVYKPAVENTTLHFTRHYYQMLYANMPAFISPDCSIDPSTDGDIDFGYVYYAGTEIDEYDIGGGYMMAGSYESTEADDNGEMYYISNEKDSDGNNRAIVFHSADGIDMKPLRVWIKPKPTTGNGEAPLRHVSFNSYTGMELDENTMTSGIEDIVMDDMTIEMYDDDNVYDMLGRVVGYGSTDSLGKGVYIFKGQKVYVR